MLIIIPPSPVEIITEQSDLFRKIFCYMKEDDGRIGRTKREKEEERRETKETKINELRENRRKWRGDVWQ